jgi:hypothetical protein
MPTSGESSVRFLFGEESKAVCLACFLWEERESE